MSIIFVAHLSANRCRRRTDLRQASLPMRTDRHSIDIDIEVRAGKLRRDSKHGQILFDKKIIGDALFLFYFTNFLFVMD